jgi:hypothetical protein
MAMRSYSAAIGILAALAGHLTAGTITFSDGTFPPANYSTAFTYIQTAGSTIGWAQCASCGNPGSALQFSITEPTGGGSPGTIEVEDAVINSTFAYDPATEGDLVSLSASADKDFTVNIALGFNNTFRPLIEQDGNYYVGAISGSPLIGPGTTGYNTLSATGLTAGNFLEVNPVTGAIGGANPNFDGDTMEFGVLQLLAATGIDGTTATTDYDNLSIVLTTQTPEPASLWTVLGGLLALGGIVWRRRAQAAVMLD